MAWPIVLLKWAPHAVTIYKEGMGFLRDQQAAKMKALEVEGKEAAAQELREMRARMRNLEAAITEQGELIGGLAEATVRDVRTLARTVYIGLAFAAVWLVGLTVLVVAG